jgi:hypothetical protein
LIKFDVELGKTIMTLKHDANLFKSASPALQSTGLKSSLENAPKILTLPTTFPDLVNARAPAHDPEPLIRCESEDSISTGGRESNQLPTSVAELEPLSRAYLLTLASTCQETLKKSDNGRFAKGEKATHAFSTSSQHVANAALEGSNIECESIPSPQRGLEEGSGLLNNFSGVQELANCSVGEKTHVDFKKDDSEGFLDGREYQSSSTDSGEVESNEMSAFSGVSKFGANDQDHVVGNMRSDVGLGTPTRQSDGSENGKVFKVRRSPGSLSLGPPLRVLSSSALAVVDTKTVLDSEKNVLSEPAAATSDSPKPFVFPPASLILDSK